MWKMWHLKKGLASCDGVEDAAEAQISNTRKKKNPKPIPLIASAWMCSQIHFFKDEQTENLVRERRSERLKIKAIKFE